MQLVLATQGKEDKHRKESVLFHGKEEKEASFLIESKRGLVSRGGALHHRCLSPWRFCIEEHVFSLKLSLYIVTFELFSK